MNSPLIWKRRKSLGARTMASCLNSFGSWAWSQRSFGAVKPATAGTPASCPISENFPLKANGFRPGAPVIPKNGWTKNLARRIQNHGPVHLSGKPDRRKAQPRLAVPGTQDFAGLLQGQPPVPRFLFRPAGLRPCDRQWDFGKPHDTLFVVGDYAF